MNERRLSLTDLALAALGLAGATVGAAMAMRQSAENWHYEWEFIGPMFASYGLAVLALVALARPRATGGRGRG